MREKCNRNCILVRTNKVYKINCLDMEKKGKCLKKNDPMKTERINKRLDKCNR